MGPQQRTSAQPATTRGMNQAKQAELGRAGGTLTVERATLVAVGSATGLQLQGLWPSGGWWGCSRGQGPCLGGVGGRNPIIRSSGSGRRST